MSGWRLACTAHRRHARRHGDSGRRRVGESPCWQVRASSRRHAARRRLRVVRRRHRESERESGLARRQLGRGPSDAGVAHVCRDYMAVSGTFTDATNRLRTSRDSHYHQAVPHAPPMLGISEPGQYGQQAPGSPATSWPLQQGGQWLGR